MASCRWCVTMVPHQRQATCSEIGVGEGPRASNEQVAECHGPHRGTRGGFAAGCAGLVLALAASLAPTPWLAFADPVSRALRRRHGQLSWSLRAARAGLRRRFSDTSLTRAQHTPEQSSMLRWSTLLPERICQTFTESGPNLAEIVPTPLEISRMRARFGPTWPKYVRSRTSVGAKSTRKCRGESNRLGLIPTYNEPI